MALGFLNKTDPHLHLPLENPASKESLVYVALWHINKS